jgi:GT2 family glycosyltransferase
LVDNASNDGTAAALLSAGYLDTSPKPGDSDKRWLHRTYVPGLRGKTAFHYLRLPTNCGGSGGFHAGAEYALRLQSDGIWLMDDDARPAEDALHRLLVYWDRPGLSALAGAVKEGEGWSLLHRGTFDFRFDHVYPLLQRPVPANRYREEALEIDMASFVGLLVKTEAMEKIGLPRKEFFMQNDDAEYCIRLNSCGRILLVPGSIILHREGSSRNAQETRWMGFSSRRLPYQQMWILYYALRNLTWIGQRYHRNAIRFYFALLRSWTRTTASALIFDHDHRWRRIQVLSAAYVDGLMGVFDNAKPRRILYEQEPQTVRRHPQCWRKSR